MNRLQRSSKNIDASLHEQLLNIVAEQMRLPLLQIARTAELGLINKNLQPSLATIEIAADAALQLIDNYLLSTKLALSDESVMLEPVSVSGVLTDAAHQLDGLARKYDCDLELHLAGRYEPIMAHRAGLEAALTSLGQVFIEAQSSLAREKHKPLVKLAAHRSRAGIVTGMFADMEGLSADMLRRARNIYGQARQPLTQLTYASGAGVFVADVLLSTMATRLRIAHHQKLSGLAATFTPSSQLELVRA